MATKHVFIANAPCTIQTTRGRYRAEAAGDTLLLSEAEADQVRAITFPQRNLLTYLGKDRGVTETKLAAAPVKKAPKIEPSEPLETQDPK